MINPPFLKDSYLIATAGSCGVVSSIKWGPDKGSQQKLNSL